MNFGQDNEFGYCTRREVFIVDTEYTTHVSNASNEQKDSLCLSWI